MLRQRDALLLHDTLRAAGLQMLIEALEHEFPDDAAAARHLYLWRTGTGEAGR